MYDKSTTIFNKKPTLWAIPRVLLFLSILSVFTFGLLMIFDTTSAEVLDHALSRSTHQALLRQMMYAVGGLFMATLVWKVGYRRFIEWSPKLLIIFSVLLFLTLIPGIGREVNGSKRWISIAGFSFQPSEFVKYIVPAYFIHTILKLKGQILELKPFLKLIGTLGIPIFLIMIEPNNGTAGVIALTVVVACIMTQVRFKYWGFPLAVVVFFGAISAYNLPYVSARLKVYLNPELDLRGKGHQPYQAKIAAGSGEFYGRGPGNSLQKLSYLPEAQNDYIAAIYAEEFGFVGMLVLILLYMIIVYAGFYIAYKTDDPGGFYMATIITFLLGFQAFMNLGVVSGLLPSTGLNLPFFSQGGTSLMANIMGLGLLCNIDWKGNEINE